ncbi:MAG: O-methyltransferase [Cytophagales bacterium]|nr:O-methyltransferase [Cytophagales bacterium]
MDFLSDELNGYIEKHTSPENQLLKQINRDTYAHVLMPRMLSGHLQGRVLSMISHMVSPRRILEIGTFTGYSALCLAEGLAPDGKLLTLDINEELETRVRNSFQHSNFSEQIDYRIGNALDIIPNIKESFDLVFIDADKENYSNYFDLVIEKTRLGGFIIADNVLWSGKVTVKPGEKIDKDTKAILDFNQKIQNESRVENVLFPIRDGLMVMRRIV